MDFDSLKSALLSVKSERAAIRECRALATLRSGPLAKMAQAGIVPIVVTVLSKSVGIAADESSPLLMLGEDMIHECLWILVNFSGGAAAESKSVFDAGAVPVISGILGDAKASTRTRDLALWCLGNLAADKKIGPFAATTADVLAAIAFTQVKPALVGGYGRILWFLDAALAHVRFQCQDQTEQVIDFLVATLAEVKDMEDAAFVASALTRVLPQSSNKDKNVKWKPTLATLLKLLSSKKLRGRLGAMLLLREALADDFVLIIALAECEPWSALGGILANHKTATTSIELSSALWLVTALFSTFPTTTSLATLSTHEIVDSALVIVFDPTLLEEARLSAAVFFASLFLEPDSSMAMFAPRIFSAIFERLRSDSGTSHGRKSIGRAVALLVLMARHWPNFCIEFERVGGLDLFESLQDDPSDTIALLATQFLLEWFECETK